MSKKVGMERKTNNYKYNATTITYREVIFDDVESLIIVKICLINAVNYLLIDAWILAYIVRNMILKCR